MTEIVQDIDGVRPENDINHKSCELCGRIVEDFHRHHLIPRKLMNSGEKSATTKLCKDCTTMVHAMHTLRELAKNYDTIEKLKNSKKLQKYLRWIRDRPIGVVKHPKRSWQGGKYE